MIRQCKPNPLAAFKQLDKLMQRVTHLSHPGAMAFLLTRSLEFLSMFVIVFFIPTSAKLNVFLDAREVSRFLEDVKIDLYLVRNGNVASILKTPILSSMIPPIESNIADIKFRFNASRKVKYSLWFESSNATIMRNPWATIPLNGLVPRKTQAFRIKFPCTRKVAGEVKLTINISFSDTFGWEIWGPLSLVLRRYCDGDIGSKVNVTQLPPPQVCNKKCGKKYFTQRFCVSDFVIRARMDSEVMKSGQPRLRVRVIRKYKQGKVKINARQLLEKRGQEITCSCSNLKTKRMYLILGKEDKRKRVLYVDDLTTALEWSRNGRQFMRSIRKKAVCPKRRTH